MRNITRTVINKEEILRYDHDFTNKVITIYLGKGTADANTGLFIQEPSRSQELVVITGASYDLLVGTVTTNKLCSAITFYNIWTAVDAVRGVS